MFMSSPSGCFRFCTFWLEIHLIAVLSIGSSFWVAIQSVTCRFTCAWVVLTWTAVSQTHLCISSSASATTGSWASAVPIVPIVIPSRMDFMIGIHYTQAMRQARPITPFQGLHHHVHVATQNMCLGMYYLWWKSLYFLFLYHYDSLIQVVLSHTLVCSCFTSNGKFCSMACKQVGYSHPSTGSWQLIYFALFGHIYDSIDGLFAQSNQHLGSKGSWIWYH